MKASSMSGKPVSVPKHHLGFFERVCKGCGEDMRAGAGKLLGFVVSQNWPAAITLGRAFLHCLSN